MENTTQSSTAPQIFDYNLKGLFGQFASPDGLMMLGALGIALLLVAVGSSSSAKITTGKFAGKSEMVAATKLSMKQIKERKHNKVTLWCGSPRYWFGGRFREMGAVLQTMMSSAPTVYLPDVQRGVLVLGIPGSGKTFSVIDSALHSAIVQGLPILLYDKKGDQMRLHATLAARHGYEVHVFAPGEPFSGVINVLDYMKSHRDGIMAGEIGQVINQNTGDAAGGKSDPFFTKAGDLLAKGILQLAKLTEHQGINGVADMGLVYAILRLSQLVSRIDRLVQNKQLDEFVAASFVQFLSTKKAEKTISGIMANATGTFSAFIDSELLRVFIGKSTIPTRIQGKQMIVFKLDDARRSVIGPLLAAALHMTVVSNLATPRKDPLVVSIDEFPSIRLVRSPQWLNEYRSNGGCFILGVQSLEQLYETYGNHMGDAIANACSTTVLFNPGKSGTAEKFSKNFGEKEVIVKSKSVSRTHQGMTVSWNDSLQKLPLLSIDEITQFAEGTCVITSPGYKSGSRTSLPFKLRIFIPKKDIELRKECEKLWESQVMPALVRRQQSKSDEELLAELHRRVDVAEHLLPPVEEESSSAPPDGNVRTGDLSETSTSPSERATENKASGKPLKKQVIVSPDAMPKSKKGLLD